MTQFPRQPEHIRPLLDAALEYVRGHTRNPDFKFPNRSEWTSSAYEAYEWLTSYGVPESKFASWVKWGMEYYKRNQLEQGRDFIVKSFRTIVHTVQPYAAQEKRTDPNRYRMEET